MRKIFFFVLIMVSAQVASAQVTLYQDTLKGQSLSAFAGVLANCYAPLDAENIQFKSAMQARMGYSTTVRLLPNVNFNSWGTLDINGIDPLVSVWLSYSPIKQVRLGAGNIAGAATLLMRPLVNSFDGVFEFAPQADNPGIAPGIRADYVLAKGNMISASISQRASKVQVQAGAIIGNIRFASWYASGTSWGGSVSANIGTVNVMATINDGKTMAGSALIPIGNGFNYVLNSRFSLRDSNSQYIETGVTQVMSMGAFNTLIGVTGSYTALPGMVITRRGNFYVMITF